MAVVRWLGGTSGNVGTAANWVGGSAPSAGVDDAVWDSVTAYGMESGTMPALVNFTITEGAGVSGAGGQNDGNLGTTSTSPLFGNVTGLFSIKSRGQFWKVGTSGTITKMLVGGTAGQSITAVTGTFTFIGAVGVDVVAEDAAVITAYDFQACRATIKTNSTAVTTGTAYDGSKVTINSRNHTTANFSGAGTQLTSVGSTTGTGASSGAVATGNFSSQATYNKQSAATDTTISLRGRKTKLTVAGNPNASVASATITTINTTDGSVLVKYADGYTLVITNEVALNMSSGGEAPLA